MVQDYRSIIKKSTELHWLRQEIKARENPQAERIGYSLTEIAERRLRQNLIYAFTRLWINRCSKRPAVRIRVGLPGRVVAFTSCLRGLIRKRLTWGLRTIIQIANMKYEISTSCQVVRPSPNAAREIAEVVKIYYGDA